MVLGLGGARKSSSCLTAAGLPRLVSRPAALPLPLRRWQRQLQQGLPALRAADGHGVHGPQLLHVAVLRVEAPRRVRRRSEGARILHRLHAPVGEVLVVLELVGVVLEDPELCGRLLLHVLGRAVHRLVGPRVVGPGRPLKVVAPLPALARHPRGQVLLEGLDAPVHHGRCVAVLGPLRPVDGSGSSRSSVANSLPRSVVTTKFPSSPVSSRAARLVARPTVSAFLFCRGSTAASRVKMSITTSTGRTSSSPGCSG